MRDSVWGQVSHRQGMRLLHERGWLARRVSRETCAGSALILTDVGAEGLNLPGAEEVFHLDVPWNPATVHQREGRADRMDQAEVTPLRVCTVRPSWLVERTAAVVARWKAKEARWKDLLEQPSPVGLCVGSEEVPIWWSCVSVGGAIRVHRLAGDGAQLVVRAPSMFVGRGWEGDRVSDAGLVALSGARWEAVRVRLELCWLRLLEGRRTATPTQVRRWQQLRDWDEEPVLRSLVEVERDAALWRQQEKPALRLWGPLVVMAEDPPDVWEATILGCPIPP
jgi:hypothetical protein